MRGRDLGLWLAIAMFSAAATAQDAPSAAGGSPPAARGVYDLELVTLKPGIHLLRRPDVFRQPVEPNALVIENAADVVVVDAGGSALAAENAIRLIRSITAKPVSLVINTHWHGDHNLGNAVYRREFPGVHIVAHRNTARAMTGAPMDYVKRYPAMLKDYVANLERDRDAGKLSPRQLAGIDDIKTMAAEFDRATVSPPDKLIDTEFTLLRGDRTIHIMYLGKGNTEGDLVVWLPEDKVLASGDLVVTPIPYGFGSFPAEWIATLDRVGALEFDTLVPGHGEVQHNRGQLKLEQEMLRAVQTQARAAVAAGHDLARFKKEIDLAAFEPQALGTEPEQRKRLAPLWRAWWVEPIARSAWLEAKGEPIVQGASDETG